MSLLNGVQQADGVRKDEDFIRGQKRQPLESDIYNLIFKWAYLEKSKKGALGVKLRFDVHGMDDRFISVNEYITTGDAKGNVTYFEKDGEKINLPGFSTIDQMARLVLGKSIVDCKTEKRTINLYDRDAKAEKPTEVEMLVELIGKGVSAAILHQIQDKTSHNAQTGNYEPNGQTFETNVVDKFLSPKDRKTWPETENNVDADFQKTWLERWKGQIHDASSGVAAGVAGTAGLPAANAPGAPVATTGSQAPAADGEKLFG